MLNYKDLYYNYTFLDRNEIALLRRLKEENINTNIETIININIDNLIKNRLIKKVYRAIYQKLNNKTLIELNNIYSNGMKLDIKQRNFFTSREINFYDVNEIDQAIIEDTEKYLFDSLDKRQQDIALSRWGYTRKKQTLAAISKRYNLSRERIRQLEYEINCNIIYYLRVHPRVLWFHIREKMTSDLTNLLPKLSRCFSSDRDFYSFIELCCKGEVETGGLLKIVAPQAPSNLLNAFFCYSSSPVVYDNLLNEIISLYGYSPALATTTLRKLIKSKKIKQIGNKIYPLNLNQKEAIAHALMNHPNGLPWKDTVEIVNANGYCSTVLNTERYNCHNFGNSEYIYLCGHGIYKNIKYLDLSKIEINKIMNQLLGYFRLNKITKSHLNSFYIEEKLQPVIEYFILRYLVKTFGSDYGIYFNGKSGTDSLSLDTNVELITQKEVILQILNKSKFPMTKHEIAENLKSKSLNHASFYLDKMMDEGSILRINYMTYTTPKQAFSGIDLTNIIELIKEKIQNTNMIIEVDIFRDFINKELNLSYSKYFYSAVATTIFKQHGWCKHNNLISKNAFSYMNLIDILTKYFDKSQSNQENKNNITKIVMLTNITWERILYQWKAKNK